MAVNLQPHREHWYSAKADGRECSSTLWCVRAVLLLLLGVAMFVLGHAMVANHFFSGGALNNHQGHLVGPR